MSCKQSKAKQPISLHAEFVYHQHDKAPTTSVSPSSTHARTETNSFPVVDNHPPIQADFLLIALSSTSLPPNSNTHQQIKISHPPSQETKYKTHNKSAIPSPLSNHQSSKHPSSLSLSQGKLQATRSVPNPWFRHQQIACEEGNGRWIEKRNSQDQSRIRRDQIGETTAGKEMRVSYKGPKRGSQRQLFEGSAWDVL